MDRRHLLKNSLALGGLVSLGATAARAVPVTEDLYSRFPADPG